MRDNDRLEDIVRKDLNVRASDRTYDRMRDIVLNAHGPSRETESATAMSIARRKIMRNPIVKFAVAAAVVAAALVGATLFRNSGSGVVWAEVAQKVQASRGVIFRTIRHDTPEPYDSGCDFRMDHYTSTQSRLDKYKGGEIIGTIYSDCNTKTVILVDHGHKSYVKMTPEKMVPDSFRMDPNSMVQRFLSCKHKELGQKTIDGVLCEGIETADPAFYGGDKLPQSLMARVWVSVETGYPVQIEGEYVNDNGQRRFTFVQDQFRWDAELDGTLFEPNIPAGYIDISP